MSQLYAYNYAVIDLTTGECLQVFSNTLELDTEANPQLIEIPEYNVDYGGKYYNQADGKWYVDAEFTTEWTPE